MIKILELAQIIIGIVLIGLILIQQRGGGLSSAFGGGGGQFYGTRRGLEKTIFGATIALSIIFVVLALSFLYLKNLPL